MSKKAKALILSISLLALLIILYIYHAGGPASHKDPDSVTPASVIKTVSIKIADFTSEKWHQFSEYRSKKKAERESKKAAKEALSVAKVWAEEDESLTYIDSYIEGDLAVIEVESADSGALDIPANSIVYAGDGSRYLSLATEKAESGAYVIRYLKIPSEVNGVSFRITEDTVFSAKAAKLYGNPLFEGDAVGTAGTWESFTRVGISQDCCYQLINGRGEVVYANGEYFRRNREDMELTEEIDIAPERVVLDVTYIPQNPQLPNGCEVTSLATVLNYLGIETSKETLSDEYLPKAPVGSANFYEEFVGNPRNSDAYGCYSPVIVDTATRYLDDRGSTLKAYDYTGSSFKDLMYKVREGSPVIVWGTTDIEKEPEFSAEWIVDGEYLVWKGSLHCMVLIGYDTLKSTVIVSDPMRGIKEYDLDLFIKRFRQFYSQAVIIE